MTKIVRCEFCDSEIDPNDPYFEYNGLKISKKQLEEIRKYMAFCLNLHGILSEKDLPKDYLDTQKLVDIYKVLNDFLMK